MHPALYDCLNGFEQIKDFLTAKNREKEKKLDNVFEDFISCYASLKEEKLKYPKEFSTDVRLFREQNPSILKKFEDREMRFLMLSDFYDYCRIKKFFP